MKIKKNKFKKKATQIFDKENKINNKNWFNEYMTVESHLIDLLGDEFLNMNFENKQRASSETILMINKLISTKK